MGRPSSPRRFWRSLTGRPTGAETCRPVTVTGDDGQPVHTMVLGGQPMSEEGQAALGEIVRAAQRKHRQQLHEEREQQARDVLAVRALTNAASRMLGTWAEANDDVRRELWTILHDRADDVHDRFRDRFAALDERAGTACSCGCEPRSFGCRCCDEECDCGPAGCPVCDDKPAALDARDAKGGEPQ